MGQVLRSNGHSRNGRVPQHEMELRITEMAKFLAKERPTARSQIKAWAVAKWGISPKSVQRYVTRARHILCEYAGESVPEMVAKSKSVYDGVITNPKSTPRDIIRAQSKQDLLLGLCQPMRVQIQAAVVTAQTSLQALPWADMARQVASMHDMALPPAPEPMHSLTDVEAEAMPAVGPILDIEQVQSVVLPMPVSEPAPDSDQSIPKSL